MCLVSEWWTGGHLIDEASTEFVWATSVENGTAVSFQSMSDYNFTAWIAGQPNNAAGNELRKAVMVY